MTLLFLLFSHQLALCFTVTDFYNLYINKQTHFFFFRIETIDNIVRLTIDKAESIDAGVFTVTLKNKHGTVSSSADVIVSFQAPQFTQPLSDIPVKINDTADLYCEVVGKPRPEVQWLADDVPVREGPKYKMVYKDTAASLRILKVTPEDAQVTYTCKATNIAGEATTLARLLPQGLSNIHSMADPSPFLLSNRSLELC